MLRRFMPAFLAAALVLYVIVALIHRQDLHHQRVVIEQEARHVLELQQELLSLEFRAVQSDLLYLSGQSALKQFLSDDGAMRESLEKEYVRFAQRKAVYDQVRFIDAAGLEVVRVNYRNGMAAAVSGDDLQSKSTRYYFQRAQALEEGDVFVSPFDLNVEHEQIERPIKPVIRFLTPVYDHLGQKRGYLVLNYLGAPLLSHLKQISAGFRGQVMVVNAAGEYVQAPDPNREWAWLLNGRHSFRVDFPEAWDHGRRVEVGQLRLGQDFLAFCRVSLGRQSTKQGSQTTAPLQDEQHNSLILVAHVSAPLATVYSRQLLNQLALWSVGVMSVIGVSLLYWARSGVIRQNQERRIAESESRLRELSSLLLAAQEAERRNLSRDLHDELGQQVTAISLDLRSLQKTGGGPLASPLLQRAIVETDKLLSSLHEIATRVRPSVLDDLGLPDAVESLVDDFQQRTGVAVKSQLDFARRNIPAPIGENVYRILQEALANVAAHARVDAAEVMMETDDEALRMTVRDPGIGIDHATGGPSRRLGILGMRERVELLNGQFELRSAPGAGTQVIVTIPLEQHES